MERLKNLGPGILFAGAAIGTSHLVQSTRAGAMYGLGLFSIILLANFLKYPAYRFGPHFAAVTGKSLIDGYYSLGRWVVALVGFIELPVIAIVIAATAVTTAAILVSVLGLDWNARYVGCGLIVIASVLVTSGDFKVLDRVTKIFVAILTLCTIVATILALPNVEWNFVPNVSEFDFKTFAFIIALMGFMPSALDLSIMHSLWAVEKAKYSDKPVKLQAVIADLNFGYILTTLLAIFFMLMGASVMYSEGTVPASSASQFAHQVISLYTKNLGEWSGGVVGIAAFSVMFTTLMTVLDGMPRLLSGVLDNLRSNHSPTKHSQVTQLRSVTIVMGVCSILILLFMMKSFTVFIDFVTIVSFLVAPVIAVLNHKVVFGKSVDKNKRPSQLLKNWSYVGIVFLSMMSIAYGYLVMMGV